MVITCPSKELQTILLQNSGLFQVVALGEKRKQTYVIITYGDNSRCYCFLTNLGVCEYFDFNLWCLQTKTILIGLITCSRRFVCSFQGRVTHLFRNRIIRVSLSKFNRYLPLDLYIYCFAYYTGVVHSCQSTTNYTETQISRYAHGLLK